MADLLAGVTDVLPVVGNVMTTIANTVGSTPVLALFGITIPLISFGGGFFLRILHRT